MKDQTRMPRRSSRQKRNPPRSAKAPRVRVVQLPAVLDMRAARELKHVLEPAYRDGAPCALELSATSLASAGCAQILASFVKSMTARGVVVALRNPTAAFFDVIGALGLTAAFVTCELEA